MIPTYTGVFSPLTLAITIVMVLYSIVLLVVLLVLAFTGRLRSSPPPPEPEPPPPPNTVAAFRLAVEEDEAEQVEAAPPAPPDDGAENDGEAPPPGGAPGSAGPRYKTGLWQLLAATGAAVPAFIVQNTLENIYGYMQIFTIATAINLLLFAGQIFLTVWLVRLQKKLPY